MFENGFLMKIINMLKKITTKLDLYKEDLTVIGDKVGIVESSVENVQNTTDEIKELVASEVSAAKNEILTELGNSGGNQRYVCTVSDNVLQKMLSSSCTTYSTETRITDVYKICNFCGTIRLKISGYSDSGSFPMFYYIYLNEYCNSFDISSKSSVTYIHDIEVSDGDTIYVSAKSSAVTLSNGSTSYHAGTIQAINLYGDISINNDISPKIGTLISS